MKKDKPLTKKERDEKRKKHKEKQAKKQQQYVSLTKKAWGEKKGQIINFLYEGARPRLSARFETVTNANHNTRLECAFVDFEESNGPWHVGRIINDALLCKLDRACERKSYASLSMWADNSHVVIEKKQQPLYFERLLENMCDMFKSSQVSP